MQQEDINNLMKQEWEPIQTIALIDSLIKNLNEWVKDEKLRLSYQIALVDVVKPHALLLSEDFKSENEGLMNVLITSRERLLKMYQNHQG